MSSSQKKRPVSASSPFKQRVNLFQTDFVLDARARSFLQLFENTSEVLALSDERGIYKYVSPAVYAHFGYHPKQIVGTRELIRLHPEDVKTASALHKKILKSAPGAVVTYELRSLHKDGTWHWYQITSNNMLHTAPLFSIFSIFRDITARKADEDRLRYYESMGNSLSDAVVSTDIDFRIVSWNRGAEELYGWKRTEVIGKASSSVLQSAFVGDTRKNFFVLLSKHGNWKGEVIQSSKGGAKLAILSSISVVKDANGKQIGFVALNRDISERKERFHALEQSEERYRAFIAHSTEGICRYELSKPVKTSIPAAKQAEYFLKYGRVAECNDAMARMYGYSKAEDLIGAPITHFLNPKNPEHVKIISSFIKSGYKLMDAEVQEYDKDGNLKYFLVNFIGVVENGIGSRAWGTKRDITDRKHAENLIKESEERFRTMADQAPVMIWMAGTNKLCYWFNKNWLDFTGKSLGQEIGNGWAEGVHPDDRQRCAKIYASSFDARKPYKLEYRLKTARGSYHWILSNGIPRFAPGGSFEGYIGACIDIDEMHVAEQRKDEFIGIASHELKTPITTVKVYLQLLQKMVESGKSNKIGVHLEKMDSQVDKLTKLVSDLLDISKIQAEKLEFNKTNFKIDDLVREIVEMLKGTIPTHSIIKKLEAKRSAYGDRDRIGQVLINLITNAAKYSPKADRIVISTNVKNGFAIVSVQDFGIGISAEHQDKVFNRFFRVEGIHEKTYPGFGMGLFISAEIIHRHGGTISVASKPGKGSTFSFTVPLEKKSFKKK